MTLAEFLLARIADDEHYAERARSQFKPDDNGGLFAAMHLLRWDPARVLAECEAKRRIIARLTDVAWSGSYAVRDVVLGEMALPYVDHQAYREEWRP